MRRADRQIKELSTIKAFIETCKVCHLGMVDHHLPYVIPLNFGYQFNNGHLTFYFHSAKVGRKIDILQANPHVCIELDSGHQLIGEGDLACVYGYQFASLIGFGLASEVTQDNEKKLGLELLMKHMTGKDGYRYENMETIKLFKIEVQEYTMKANQKQS